MGPQRAGSAEPEGVWGVMGRGWEKSVEGGLRNQLCSPQGLPGVYLETWHTRNLSTDMRTLATLQCWIPGKLSVVWSPRDQETLDFPGPSLALEFQGLCPETLALGGEKRKPRSSGVSQQKVPAPDIERFKVIFLLRKKPFIILLGLSEAIWTDFPSLVCTCKSERAYLSSPQFTLKIQGEKKEENFSFGQGCGLIDYSVTPSVPLTEWKEAVNCLCPQNSLYVDYVWKSGS